MLLLPVLLQLLAPRVTSICVVSCVVWSTPFASPARNDLQVLVLNRPSKEKEQDWRALVHYRPSRPSILLRLS